jgi:hypothetical protein
MLIYLRNDQFNEQSIEKELMENLFERDETKVMDHLIVIYPM